MVNANSLQNYRFILIGCDGIWKVFSAEDAAKFVIQVLEVQYVYPYCNFSDCPYLFPHTLTESVQDESIKLPKGIE